MRFTSHTFKVIDWTVFLALLVLALSSVKESIEAYSKGKTSWSMELLPIQNQPTLSMCFALSHVFTEMAIYPLIYGEDFNISVTTSKKRF